MFPAVGPIPRLYCAYRMLAFTRLSKMRMPEDVNSTASRGQAGGISALCGRFLQGRRAWGLADQVLISGTNFVTMVFAGRGMGKTGFGEFSLVYNALLFANMIQISLVTQPHNVLGTGRAKGSAYASYTASTGVLQVALAAAQALLALLFVGIAYSRHWSATSLLAALVPAIVAWQLQEFVRRILYTEGRTAAAFLNDVISYGGQAVWIVILYWLDCRTNRSAPTYLTGPAALYVLAITSAAGAVLGLFQIGRSLCGRIHAAVWAENWHFGKWLLGSEILTYFSSLPMYMNIVGWMVGAAASGELKAAQTLFGPARVISFYLATVLPIQFARELAEGGNAALHRQLKSTALSVLPVLAVFCLLIALFAAPLLRIFGRDFASQPRVLALYAIVAFLTYGQMVLIAALTAKRLTQVVFFSSVAGAAITGAFSFWLIKTMLIDGALIAMILTGLAMTGFYWLGYRRCMMSGPAATAGPGSGPEVGIPAEPSQAIA